jgi:hypothetical protein
MARRHKARTSTRFDLGSVYFPPAEVIQPFAIALVNMMFAQAKFVSLLQAAITGDPEFGERGSNQWAPRDRPKKMTGLIRRHLGSIPETAEIRKVLKDPCLYGPRPSRARLLVALRPEEIHR